MGIVNTPIIIIGAGIAGLTAAWHLKQSGIPSLILEAENHVGGRMHSVVLQDAIIDDGAQFLSDAYTIIPKLIHELGMDDQFVATGKQVGLVRTHDIALIEPRKPWTLVTSGLLSVKDFFRLGLKQYTLFRHLKKSKPFSDITAWTHYDAESAANWLKANFGLTITREFSAAIINGFYFQSLQSSSAALMAAVSAFSICKPKTMTLKTGMSSLPQMLAQQLQVKTGVIVTDLRETTAGIHIKSNAGEWQADQVILTVPAPVAKNLIKAPDPESAALLKTPYSSSVVISYLSSENWSPPRGLAKIYGVLVNPRTSSPIAACTLENNKSPTRKQRGYLINVMLTDTAAKEWLHLSDEAISACIKNAVENIFPGLYPATQTIHLTRWPYAMPCTPLGRAQAVKDYRDSRISSTRLWLAGDYLGFPWTDSAAQTGIWAAEQVKQAI